MTHMINWRIIKWNKQIITATTFFISSIIPFIYLLCHETNTWIILLLFIRGDANLTIKCNAKSAFKAKQKIWVINCFLSGYINVKKIGANKRKNIRVLGIYAKQSFSKKTAWIDLVYFEWQNIIKKTVNIDLFSKNVSMKLTFWLWLPIIIFLFINSF